MIFVGTAKQTIQILVTTKYLIKCKLDNLNYSNFDFICGDHFCDTCFDVNGDKDDEAEIETTDVEELPTVLKIRKCKICQTQLSSLTELKRHMRAEQ